MQFRATLFSLVLFGAGQASASCAEIGDEQLRLKCYDAVAQGPGSSCKMEDFTYSDYGSGLKVSGSMTCPKGRMDYRLYDGDDKLLVSGFTYFQGYSLQILERVPPPSELNIKYSVEQN